MYYIASDDQCLATVLCFASHNSNLKQFLFVQFKPLSQFALKCATFCKSNMCMSVNLKSNACHHGNSSHFCLVIANSAGKTLILIWCIFISSGWHTDRGWIRMGGDKWEYEGRRNIDTAQTQTCIGTNVHALTNTQTACQASELNNSAEQRCYWGQLFAECALWISQLNIRLLRLSVCLLLCDHIFSIVLSACKHVTYAQTWSRFSHDK